MISPIPSALPPCPFIAGPRIEDRRLFVGRKDELNYITTHMTGAQPISVNVVGDRRIGKSSLLFHFFQTWEQRVQNIDRHVVIYLSLQGANCHSRSGFYQAIIQELRDRPYVQVNNSLHSTLQMATYDDTTFALVLKEWKQQQVLPLVCLDEFEALLKHTDEFNDDFYDHLRSLMDNNLLMMVIASHKPLDIYREAHLLTSSFFNIGHVLYLGELTDSEVDDLVRLPASTIPGAQAALSGDEQQHARKWGHAHPYMLQLAGSLLCQTRQQGKTLIWAKNQFDVELRRLIEPPPPVPNLWVPLRWLIWSFPLRLGRFSKFIGVNIDDYKHWITGVMILALVLVLIIFVSIHLTTIAQILTALFKFMGLGG